jgi:tRNA (guanine37-N1)-methyltransferase
VRIDVVTLFPELFEVPLRTSLLGRAAEKGILSVHLHDLREHGLGKHRSVDDSPYGGGPGMVLRPEPIFAAVEDIPGATPHKILLSPRGTRLDHAGVARLVSYDHLILIAGRYEGVDERVADHLVDEQVSIGDFVLSGGELPALVLIEAVSRFLPGVLGNAESLSSESHADGDLEYPQYTRPAEWRGLKVPDVLLSGDHEGVARWRAEQARRITLERRPDLG